MMSSVDIGMARLLEQLQCAMAGVGLKLNRLKFVSLREKVQKSIHAISRAPLKPCQRLHILQVPSLVHMLRFENISLRVLASSDTAIRKATRKWVHLPEDDPFTMLLSNKVA